MIRVLNESVDASSVIGSDNYDLMRDKAKSVRGDCYLVHPSEYICEPFDKFPWDEVLSKYPKVKGTYKLNKAKDFFRLRWTSNEGEISILSGHVYMAYSNKLKKFVLVDKYDLSDSFEDYDYDFDEHCFVIPEDVDEEL